MQTIRQNHGFTLIDIIIGMFLFSIGVLGVLKMQLMATQYQGAAKFRSEAVFLAEQRMEELMRTAYLAIVPSSEDLPPYRISWAVADQGDFKEIAVTVNWQDHGDKTLSLESIRGDLH